MNIEEILSQPGRTWTREKPASDEEIDTLASCARAKFPAAYLDLLRFSNGGEGPLRLAPLWFQLYSVEDCIRLCHNTEIIERFPDFMFFGNNGGLESIAFDLRVGPPWPIVAVDQIAGSESAESIASDFPSFVSAIGLG